MSYKRGENPKSLANLTMAGKGRPAKWGDRRKREVLVSQVGWDGALEASKLAGCSGVSEMLERLGRGELVLSAKENPLPEK